MSDKPSTVVMLPGLVTTPEVFVERLRENAKKIKNIACVVQWDTNDTEAFSTEMPIGDAAWLKYVFDKDFPE